MNTMSRNSGTKSARWLLAALLLGAGLAMTGRAIAEEAFTEEMVYGEDTSRWVTAVTLGFHQWPAAAELDTQPYGEFDENGYNISGSVHRRWRHFGGGELLLGADLGLMTNESNIVAPEDHGEMAIDVFSFTPSLRWSFSGPGRNGHRPTRYNLEAGAGVYWARIAEMVQGEYGPVPNNEHYNNYAPGGYLGLSVDVPLRFLGDNWAFNTAARVHYATFGDVDALGRNLGGLDGPITTLQLGMTYDW